MAKMLVLVAGLCLASIALPPTAQGVPFSGTISNQIGPLAPVGFAGGGDGVSNALAATLGAGATLTGTTTVPLSTVTPGGMVSFTAFPLVELALTGPQGIASGSFSAGGGPAGGFGGDAPQQGFAKLGLFHEANALGLMEPLETGSVQSDQEPVLFLDLQLVDR